MSFSSNDGAPDSRSFSDHDALLDACEQKIQYRFKDRELLTAALTHASSASHRLASNERLEFLGDAILGLVVCEQLFHSYPEFLEGELTRVKSVVVSRLTCARISTELKLDECLLLGKGMAVHRTIPKSLMADVFESLVAAIYLDGGIEEAKRFIESHAKKYIEEVVSGAGGENHKSLLQHFVQREFGRTPTYALLEEKGPDHNKSFKIAAQIGKRLFAPAWGRSKKDAEQSAAKKAMECLSESSLSPEELVE
jgi:ribonuclease-3